VTDKFSSFGPIVPNIVTACRWYIDCEEVGQRRVSASDLIPRQ
jgi:hypothetical protein